MKRVRLGGVTLGFIASLALTTTFWGAGIAFYALTGEYAWGLMAATWLALLAFAWEAWRGFREVKARRAEGCWERCPHVQS